MATKIKAQHQANQPLIDALCALGTGMKSASTQNIKLQWRAESLLKAAQNLARLDFQITDGKVLAQPGRSKVPGVGKGTAYYIDEFLQHGKIAETERYPPSSPAVVPNIVSPERKKRSMTADIVVINRAPVLKLWVVVLAQTLGHSLEEALSYGHWIAGTFARAKAKSLGMVEQADDETDEKERPAKKPKHDTVQIFAHVKIPVEEKNGKRLAIDSSSGRTMTGSEASLKSAFSDRYEDTKEAMQKLASSYASHQDLQKLAYTHYEQFRPAWTGWGHKSILDLELIRSMATENEMRQK